MVRVLYSFSSSFSFFFSSFSSSLLFQIPDVKLGCKINPALLNTSSIKFHDKDWVYRLPIGRKNEGDEFVFGRHES